MRGAQFRCLPSKVSRWCLGKRKLEDNNKFKKIKIKIKKIIINNNNKIINNNNNKNNNNNNIPFAIHFKTH